MLFYTNMHLLLLWTCIPQLRGFSMNVDILCGRIVCIGRGVKIVNLWRVKPHFPRSSHGEWRSGKESGQRRWDNRSKSQHGTDWVHLCWLLFGFMELLSLTFLLADRL